MNDQEIKELIERLRGIYPVGEYGIRKFETPIIQQEAVAAIEQLQAELRAKDEQFEKLLDRYTRAQKYGYETIAVQQVVWDIEKAKGESK